MPMLWTLLAACGGPSDETRVEELRVMAAVMTPPEAAPGAEVGVEVHLLDPVGDGAEVLLWTCLDLGDGCLEAQAPGLGTTVAAPEAGVVRTTRTAPAELAAFLDAETVLPVPLWALACAPGVCPVIDAARAAPDPGSAEADALATQLADPTAWLAELPMQGVSLGFGTIGVSLRAEPVTNPRLVMVHEALEPVDAGGSFDLSVLVEAEGEVTVWGYATGGGFGAPADEVQDGMATLTYFAPEDPSEVEVLLVAVGADGGSAVWRGPLTIR